MTKHEFHREWVNHCGWFWVAGLFFAVWFSLCGCGTVTPKQVKAAQGSFGEDGQQDSGFKGFTNQPYAHCGVFSASAVARYNLLALKWGNDSHFVPPVKPWDGVLRELDGKTFTNYVLSPSAIVNFMELSAIQRAGK